MPSGRASERHCDRLGRAQPGFLSLRVPGVAEFSAYVAESARGNGIGRALLAALVEASARADIWTLQAGIFPENVASVELHKRAGFSIVGVREKLGQMDGRWRDVLLMERRSPKI